MTKPQMQPSDNEQSLQASVASEDGFQRLAKRAESDKAVREQLLREPAPLFKEYNIEIPEGFTPRVELDGNVLSCVLEAVDAAELPAQELEAVVGGDKAQTTKTTKSTKTSSGAGPYLTYQLNDALISG